MKTPEEFIAERERRMHKAWVARGSADPDLNAEWDRIEHEILAEALSAGKKAGAAAERERCVATLKLMARVHSQRPGHADRVLNDAISLILSPTTEDTHD